MDDALDRAFLDRATELQRALRVHCYRMLGSSHDSEDMVQETMLRAWRAKETLSDPAMLRPWLYRIATNVCLDELARRPKRALALEGHPAAADPAAPLDPPITEPVWIEPMPDRWIDADAGPDPGARYASREGVALAFVAALQVLTPIQRATLLLRDVVGLTAEETAQALDVSVGAANSALFRARETIEAKLGGREAAAAARAAEAREAVDQALLARYVRAFEEANVGALVDLLHAEVQTRMPPRPTWIAGRDDNLRFYHHMFATTQATLGRPRMLPTRANGLPAFGYYRRAVPGGPLLLHAVHVVTLAGGLVTGIDHFMLPSVFSLFELPPEAA